MDSEEEVSTVTNWHKPSPSKMLALLSFAELPFWLTRSF